MKIKIPKLSLVVLIGASGSGKSTFCRRHFLPTEVVSSDTCRGIVADDENDQSATPAAFELLHFILEQRLKAGKLCVVDATNVQPEARQRLVALARKYHMLPVAIALKVSEDVCLARNAERPDRQFGPHVVRRQVSDMRRSLGNLKREGFRHMFYLNGPEEIDRVEITRESLFNDKRHLSGPFDLIGDVHGCYDELVDLLIELGYTVDALGGRATAPEGRTAVFLGDLIDRGPNSPAVLRLVMNMVRDGHALAVPGNHDMKLVRYLNGGQVKLTHGLELTVEQLSHETPEFREEVGRFLDRLVSHYVLDEGRLVVAHAGMPESMQGRGSGAVRSFAMYGETTGETDEFGLPVRYKWATDYRGLALVAYGHTPTPEPDWLNNTVCLDTGCVFGGKLTALRYPEREAVSVQSRQVYAEPKRPFMPELGLSSQHQVDDVLDVTPFLSRMHLRTRFAGNVVIAHENAVAALEVMGRFAVNPKWLITLPPTMSPTETSEREDYLEYPTEAFNYYREQGVHNVVCEEKHMGSRALVVLARNEDVARERFGVVGEGVGTIFTRTGRPFFDSAEMTQALLQRVASAAEMSGLWEELHSDWVVLDAELMPWSAKAQGLLRSTYAPVGVAGQSALGAFEESLLAAKARLPAVAEFGQMADRTGRRKEALDGYVAAYQRYCWPVSDLEDFKLAPFHILASEGRVHIDQPHTWHMDRLHRLCEQDSKVLRATPYRVVDVNDADAVASACAWWEELTGAGGEGMVVKPFDFMPVREKGFVQPALKCRGREYLRIIYGPEYLLPENLLRLRSRNLRRKRSLAQREFGLGVEALERFVRREPLRNVHECVFGVLALESEPVDPRL